VRGFSGKRVPVEPCEHDVCGLALGRRRRNERGELESGKRDLCLAPIFVLERVDSAMLNY